MKRLPKGFGSVHKLSGNRRKPYAARVLVSKDERGKSIFKYIGYYETAEKALMALTEFNKNPFDAENMDCTVSDLYELFKERKFQKLSPQSIRGYQAAFKHLQTLQDREIRKIRTYDIQSVIDSLTTGPRSKSSVQGLMSQLFEIAMELDIVQKNYASYAVLPTEEKSGIHSSFTEAEITSLFEHVLQYPYADTVLILIYTGMRPIELLTMKKENVDMDNRIMIGGSKTKAGKNRVIPIHSKIFPFIRKRYLSSQSYLIEENGRPLSYTMYKKRFNIVMNGLQMSHLPHDGRHTFASLMDTAGANKQAIKLIMGHVSQDITNDVYTHKSKEELLSNVNLI